MPALRLLNVLALVSLALVALSSAPLPANALVADRAEVVRRIHDHDALARRKRSDSSGATGSCKPRPSSTPAPTSTAPSTTTPSSSPSTTSTSSSAPPSTTTAANPGNGQKKWCLAWGGDNRFLPNFALPGVGYLYDWNEYIPPTLPNGVVGMPMLWGYKNAQAFQNTVVEGYANYALGMNEPNEPGQSNISPNDAIGMWMQYINPLKDKGYTLVSPACTNDDAGAQWYKTFMELCQSTPGCQVDVMAFHAYTLNAQDFIDFANMLHDSYGRPVAVTEFACENFSDVGGQASMIDIWNFAGTIRAFVEGTEWLMMACPFGAMTNLQGVNPLNALMDGSGNITSLGSFYLQ